VANPFVTTNLHLATDISGHFTAEVTLNLERSLNVLTQEQQLVVRQIFDADAGIDSGNLERLLRAGATDSIDVGKGDFDPLFAGNIDSG
jgi:hypothetical protein